MKRTRFMTHVFAVIVISMFINLPLVSSLEFSEVRATHVTDTSAVIEWQTDEPSDSFVNYGENKDSLTKRGDAARVTSHSITLNDLTPSTRYVYSVESDDELSDSGGSLYSFETQAPDTTPPDLVVELPELVAGTTFDLEGQAEVGARVEIFVNNALAGSSVSALANEDDELGIFVFTGIVLERDGENAIRIEASDASDNMNKFEGSVFTDTTRPTLELGEIPELVDKTSFVLTGTISEEASYEIFVGNKSVRQGTGTSFSETITLEEGDNEVEVVVTDAAGFETRRAISLASDTKPPTVKFTVERGNEFYEGRAVSSVNGETEPGAKVFLYVYRPLSYEYEPDFSKAWTSTTADDEGAFTFTDVNFESEPFSLEDLAPQQVPSGLQEYSIFPVKNIAEQQRRTYHVFVITEDKSGKTAHAQQTINLNTCFSNNFAFDVREVVQFHTPLRLNPQLLDEGREVVHAVFNLSYRGNGHPQTDKTTGDIEKDAFEIMDVQFEKACTQATSDDPSFELGCKLFPSRVSRPQPSTDKTSWYITANLRASEDLSESDEDFWDEMRKRQVVFPLKVKINYRERLPDGNLGPTKTQTSCEDLGYFVDIPIDSADMIPDFLAEEGLIAINETINAIDEVLPYLEKAILVTGVGCMTSFLGRMATRWYRIFVSNVEATTEESCPSIEEQGSLLLEDTIDDWSEESALWTKPENQPTVPDWQNKENSLDQKCPMTAGAWQAEAALDQAYRWTCDRVYCRAVPAGWTAEKEKHEVDTVVEKQNQCSASARGIPLIPRENCQEIIKQDITNPNQIAQAKMKDGAFTCYQHDDSLYVINNPGTSTEYGTIVELQLVHTFGLSLGKSFDLAGKTNLFAFRPRDSDTFIVGQDQSCQAACRNPRRDGYKYDQGGGITSINTLGQQGKFGCYREFIDETPGSNAIILHGTTGDRKGKKVGVNAATGATTVTATAGNTRRSTTATDGAKELTYSAGYTRDCFLDVEKTTGARAPVEGEGETCSRTADCRDGLLCIDAKCKSPSTSNLKPVGANIGDGKTGLLQCVCKFDEQEKNIRGARVAAKANGEQDEEWSYRQDRVYKESGTFKKQGTYYPEWRYYDGRDTSSAFGADYLLDYLRADGDEQVHEVNPSTQHIGAFQTMCLSQIRARIVTLKSILQGFESCIQEAKFTGLQDAGMCKTLFSQHVCGLIYKSIAYFFNQCTPHTFQDETKETNTLDDVGTVFSEGFSAIPAAMETSIDDIKSDYNNAALNEYFSTGAQGFTQSICLAAFGYDWPMGADFILDSAYAVPSKTTVHVLPAEREFATFDPSKGTTLHNYNVGAVVLPGCRIKSADVSLKCIGQEDFGRPGIDCAQQQCDCLHATQRTSSLEGEKTMHLEHGRIFDMKQGQFVDLAIPAPQKINSHYRYDHVVVSLNLDSNENAESCFDEGYRDGKFYFPITDISPPGELACQVQLGTGQYLCPEFVSLFGGGSGVYLEDPFITCFDSDTDSWVDCNTPNLFSKGDLLKIQTHVFTTGEPACMNIKVTGLGSTPQDFAFQKLPEGVPGSFTPDINLGTIGNETFSGLSGNVLLTSGISDSTCSQPHVVSAPTTRELNTQFKFTYRKIGPDQFTITVPGAAVPQAPYTRGGDGTLTLSGRNTLSRAEVLAAVYNVNGIMVENLAGVQSDAGDCVYQTIRAVGQSLVQNQKSISVTASLYKVDSGGACFNAKTLVKAPAFGRSRVTEQIKIQLEPILSQVASRVHREFMNGNYGFVIDQTRSILNRQNNDLEDAAAIYYKVAAHIAQAQENNADWKQGTTADNVCTLLNIFFDGEYKITGQFRDDYPFEVKKTTEYKKVHQYLTVIGNALTSCTDLTNMGLPIGSGGSTPTVPAAAPTPTPTTSLCGKPSGLRTGFVKPTAVDTDDPDNPVPGGPGRTLASWENYVCKTADSPKCVSATQYVPEEKQRESGGLTKYGCPDVQRCCPP